MNRTADAKAELRTLIRSNRRDRTPAARDAVAVALAQRVAEIHGYDTARTVTAYASFGTEPGTSPLLARLVGDGKSVLLPIVHDNGTLGWMAYTGPESLRFSDRGIPEPVGTEIGSGAAALVEAEVDIMLIPALAVDLAGRRIGKGGGFYDRVLAELPADRPLRIAVVHDEDVLPAGGVPAEAHDQRVHLILTQTRVVELPR